MDNLKVALTVLVVLHHVGQPYGDSGGFWYFEQADRWSLLRPFFAVNASFFMGLFFFVSAYFLPGSYDRKGAGPFLRDRLQRLGIPLVVLLLTAVPLITYFSYVNFRGSPLPFGEYLTQVFFGGGPKPEGWRGPNWPEVHFAHLWFVEHLLVYALLYAGLRLAWRGKPLFQGRADVPPSDGAILAFTLLLTAVTLLVRLWYPLDRWVGLLGFIQLEPAHLPQYLSFFVLGTVAARQGWLTSLPARQGMRWLAAGLAAAVLMVICVLVLRHILPAGLYFVVRTIVESFIAVGLSLGLIILFRERANGTSRLGRILAENAYGAYLFHVPLVVALQYAAAPLRLSAASKFFLVGAVSVVVTFWFSHLVRMIPGARRIL
ncbi:MAG: acyltransferase family protein [Bacillota bacterium]